MVKIDVKISDQTMISNYPREIEIALSGDSPPQIHMRLLSEDHSGRADLVIKLTPGQSEAVENALRILRREAERRAR